MLNNQTALIPNQSADNGKRMMHALKCAAKRSGSLTLVNHDFQMDAMRWNGWLFEINCSPSHFLPLSSGYIPFIWEFVYLFGCAPSILQAHLTHSVFRSSRSLFHALVSVRSAVSLSPVCRPIWPFRSHPCSFIHFNVECVRCHVQNMLYKWQWHFGAVEITWHNIKYTLLHYK